MSENAPEPDNPLIEQPGAILFKSDPTGETEIRAEWLRDLTGAEYERFSKALNAMSDIFVTNMFAYYRQAAIDMLRTVGEAYKALYENKISTLQPDDVVEWSTRIRTGVLGMCAAIHHHQDQSYIEVKRKFGKDSPEHIAMKAAFGQLYDNCFGYRYLYKLRNTMVHYTMLAVAIGAESHMRDGQKIHWWELRMDRSAMLDQRDFLNAKLKAELEALSEDPDIIDMANEATPELLKTNRRIVEILHPEIAEIAATVVEFDKLFGGQDGVRAISRNRSKELRRPFKFSFQPIAGRVIIAARTYVGLTDA